MAKLIIGIDNGVTGSIGFISEDFTSFVLTPVRKEQNYTKKKDLISRVDSDTLSKMIIAAATHANASTSECLAVLERPMLNPQRWAASISAARALEATQVVLESYHIPYMFIDSKEWQRKVLPSGYSGSAELKKASMDIGCRLYPQFSELIKKHKDADGLLIAHHAYREKY